MPFELKWHLITGRFYSPMDSQLKQRQEQVLQNVVTQIGIGFVLTPTVTTENVPCFTVLLFEILSYCSQYILIGIY